MVVTGLRLHVCSRILQGSKARKLLGYDPYQLDLKPRGFGGTMLGCTCMMIRVKSSRIKLRVLDVS